MTSGLPEKVRAIWCEAAVALIFVGGLGGEARFFFVILCVFGGQKEREKGREKGGKDREKYVEMGK